jgi:hypothetical protein
MIPTEEEALTVCNRIWYEAKVLGEGSPYRERVLAYTGLLSDQLVCHGCIDSEAATEAYQDAVAVVEEVLAKRASGQLPPMPPSSTTMSASWWRRNLPAVHAKVTCAVAPSPPPPSPPAASLFVPASSIQVPPLQDRWLIDGLLGKESVAVIGGAPKRNKSWLAAEIAVAVASSSPCLGQFSTREAGTVLMCSGEGPEWIATDRFRNICGFREQDLNALPIHVMSRTQLRLDDPADQRTLTREVEESKATLLIIDPLTAYHSGDENSVLGLAPVLQYLDRLRRTTGATVLVVHHSNKKGSGHGGNRLRGTSALHGWLDSGLYLEKRGDGVVVSVEQRCGPAPDDFFVRLTGEQGGYHLEVGDRPSAEEDDLSELIVEALREKTEPVSRSVLRSLLGVKAERLTEPLAHLDREGVIRRTSEGIELVVVADDNDDEDE